MNYGPRTPNPSSLDASMTTSLETPHNHWGIIVPLKCVLATFEKVGDLCFDRAFKAQIVLVARSPIMDRWQTGVEIETQWQKKERKGYTDISRISDILLQATTEKVGESLCV